MKFITMSSASILLALSIGGQVALAAEEAPATPKEYNSNAIVEFTPDTGINDPVDPIDPDPNDPVKPFDPTTPDNKPGAGTTGPLSIDFASSIDFGLNKITSKDVTYYATPQYYWSADESGADLSTARPNYVQISDKRGTNAGWTLTVRQNGQFKNAETQNKELNSAEIKFVQGTPASASLAMGVPNTYEVALKPTGESSKVMGARATVGAGTWVNAFGSVEDVDIDGTLTQKNTGISLSIPSTTPIDAVKYTTSLTWSLSEVPDNE